MTAQLHLVAIIGMISIFYGNMFSTAAAMLPGLWIVIYSFVLLLDDEKATYEGNYYE
jgi:hypothetical protein